MTWDPWPAIEVQSQARTKKRSVCAYSPWTGIAGKSYWQAMVLGSCGRRQEYERCLALALILLQRSGKSEIRVPPYCRRGRKFNSEKDNDNEQEICSCAGNRCDCRNLRCGRDEEPSRRRTTDVSHQEHYRERSEFRRSHDSGSGSEGCRTGGDAGRPRAVHGVCTD